MNVGYGYLINPPVKGDEKDGQIEDADLAKIRKYMCPISNGDFRRCGNCQGLKTCRVGQRVQVLIAERDQKREQGKWQKVLEPEPGKPAVSVEEGQKGLLRSACESGNAWNYIMQKTGQSRDAAKETLLGLIRKHPAIAAEYGGSRRIMQRPRVVTITSIGKDGEPEPNEEVVPGAVPEPNEEAKAVEPQPNPKRRKGIAEAALALYQECINADDPVGYYAAKRGATRNAGRLFLMRMKSKLQNTDGGEMEAKADEPVTQEVTEEDTISLADFLQQYDVNPEHKPEPQVEITAGKIVGEMETPGVDAELHVVGVPMSDLRILESAQSAMDTLCKIMSNATATDEDRIKAAEVMLRFYAGMKGGLT